MTSTLQIRPGARFACRGDGLCCGDVHLWGPISEDEAEALALISPDLLTERPDDGTRILQARTDGRCLLWQDGCALHAALGPQSKPRTCRKFPFSLTGTPSGVRVGLSYRCSCVIVPSGPPIEAADVAESVADASGNVEADSQIRETVYLDVRQPVPFARWEALEKELLARLANEGPESVLDRDPFALASPDAFRQLGEALVEGQPETRAEHAVAWFGDALLARFADRAPPARARPWADAFDAAEPHIAETTADALLSRWIADDVWALDWARGGNFALARSVLACRVAVARDVAARIEGQGASPARAIAESILVATLTGVSEPWAAMLQSCRVRRAE